MTELVIFVIGLQPDVLPSPTPSSAVYPRGAQGFAAYLIGGFFGLGILLLAMVLLNRRPKRGDRSRPRQ